MRVETIGAVTLYWQLSRSQRHRLRKKGFDIPRKPMPSGYQQAPEHVEKRTRKGEAHYAWLGDAVSSKGGRTRAIRAFPSIGPCRSCGAAKTERHHIDGNTANNAEANIATLCRRCHMTIDGRLEQCREWASCARK